ncbi:MAG TPA: hypothetical protein VG323_15300 [Thermoanaerobaculia bacterium]|nr:hypothetical protein [Thermoanaerobaculia bacterium]
MIRSYAYTRIRARKGQLLGTREAALLLAADHPLTALAALGGDPFEKLLRIYDVAIRIYRAPIFRALLGLHEIENVKLLWRVASRAGVPPAGAAASRRLWIPLGALATVTMPRDVLSLRGVVEHLAKTPYGEIAKRALAVTQSGEAIFDRWARQRVLDEAARLPAREALTRKMIESGRASRRAFAGSPFLLAPAVAVVLLAEAEVRAVRAIVERDGDTSLDDVVLRIVAQSQMGGG